jgi:hypothetical protein
MLGTLTEPVLSVAADVVRDIDGGLALSGLCTRQYRLRHAASRPILPFSPVKCSENAKHPYKTARDWRTSPGVCGTAKWPLFRNISASAPLR